ncbi:hypothetical protein [Sphaerothrix gracilis]|uniref:hypothetical protein n=1 Tax=Sphaerothrix gracilis TaxID=3151835 RepID=UPI0031FC0F85
MASSSRPYQSRLLKGVLRQVHQVSDRYQRSLRQLKVAATWGAQVVLYPVYALFQTSRVAKRQFGQAPQPKRSLLGRLFGRPAEPEAAAVPESPQASEPILQVLQLFAPPRDRLTLPEAAVEDGALAPATVTALTGLPQTLAKSAAEQAAIGALKVQGIASYLGDRRLVLIAAGNAELDILTAQQQAALSKYISWAIAHYWYAQRQARAFAQAQAGILPLPRRKSRALPPVELFRQLMGWMQTSPVAIATNLFKESELVAALGWRRRITTHQRSPALSLPESSFSPPRLIQPQLAPYGQQIRQFLRGLRGWQNTLAVTPDSSSLTAECPQPPLFSYRQRLMSLLAKLRQPQSLRQVPPASSQPLASPKRPFMLAQLDKLLSRSPVAGASSVSVLDVRESQFSSTSVHTNRVIPLSHTSRSPIQMTQATAGAATANPDWIETTATVIEYIEHPLEKLLRWIDQGLLWLEEWFERLRDRLRGDPGGGIQR